MSVDNKAYLGAQRWLPDPLRRYILFFETAVADAVTAFAAATPEHARVLDAGAGECQYASSFAKHRYTGVDLGIGNEAWSYRRLSAVADLAALPFAEATFDACINVVTLESKIVSILRFRMSMRSSEMELSYNMLL